MSLFGLGDPRVVQSDSPEETHRMQAHKRSKDNSKLISGSQGALACTVKICLDMGERVSTAVVCVRHFVIPFLVSPVLDSFTNHPTQSAKLPGARGCLSVSPTPRQV